MAISKELRAEYENIIGHVSKLMIENAGDWTKRYKDYLHVLNPKSTECTRIRRMKNMFQIETPITRYLSISYAKKAKNAVVFDLRVYGHSIGNLVVKLDAKVKSILDADVFDSEKLLKMREDITYVAFNENNSNALKWVRNQLARDTIIYDMLDRWITKYIDDKIVNGDEADGLNKKQKTVKYAWKSEELRRLRSILQLGEDTLNLETEHACENLLLKELSKKDGTGKYIKNIQPVTICDTGFFQLATCLKGSDAKKDISKITYSKQYGGGIDILARISKGNKSELCVIELKDKYEHNERPIKAMKQAISYAVFLDYLIRDERANGESLSWYEDIFTNGRTITDKIRINVVVAMPYESGVESQSQVSEEDAGLVNEKFVLDINGHNDELVLHYIFFKPEALQQDGINEGIVTSLFDK